MKAYSPSEGLTGRLLIAMPSITESGFRKGVVLVCAHSVAGAVGLLINRPTTNMSLRRLLRESGLETAKVTARLPIHAGGPAEIERTFVLHSPDYRLTAHTIEVTTDLHMTPHPAVAEDLSRWRGPKRAFIAMGYCGWGIGQLEQEVRDGHWLTATASADDVFATPAPDRWLAAMTGMGIPPSSLSSVSGHA